MDDLVYIPGDEPRKSPPLARYLPPVPEGVASTFLRQYSSRNELRPGAWALDPLGASPLLAIEIAAQGYRSLVAVNNPITRFLLDMTANPPSLANLRSALEDLAASRKGDDRLENHIQSLYLTNCTKCQQQIPAEAFVWERASGALLARIYHCSCGDSGEYPANEADLARAASLTSTDALHRARLLERVAAQGDPDRIHVEEALVCYLPRPIYALITIINKLDSLTLEPERKKALFALILTACDEASALWPYPEERPRPKQLALPPRFLEKNVWLALEHGVEMWTSDRSPIPVTIWPEIPAETGGLCLFDGPMRNLSPHLKDLSIATVLTAFPRPNQAFWTLSALWAGWLWGKEAAAPFKAVLRRRRYDWNWHASALSAALEKFSERLPLNTPIFAIVPELEPAFLSAVLVAAQTAGLDLDGLALRSRHDPAQVLWHRRAFAHAENEPEEIEMETVHQAIHLSLQERAEPVPYLFLHAAGLAAMAGEHALHLSPEGMTQIHSTIQATLNQPEFIHFSESPNPESGYWALKEWEQSIEPLPDRVELAIVHYLEQQPGCSLRELETAVNTLFNGLSTPSTGLIQAILCSYAIEAEGRWSLRPEDGAGARRSDLESAAQSLAVVGQKLGYIIQRSEQPRRKISWFENGRTVCEFHLLASARVASLLRQKPGQPTNSFLVVPGGRASLLAYKFDRDPALRSSAQNWSILKFRQIRRLAGLSGLTRENLLKEFSNDPIAPLEQMKLF